MVGIIKKILYFIVFAVCIGLVVIGQRNIGVSGLLVMLAGLVGLLVLLFLYNKRYQ